MEKPLRQPLGRDMYIMPSAQPLISWENPPLEAVPGAGFDDIHGVPPSSWTKVNCSPQVRRLTWAMKRE